MGSDRGALYAAAMLVSGTFSTVIMKTEYGVRAHGTERCVDPQDPTQTTTLCPFDKPWFGVLQMKIAMALCLVFLYARKAVRHKSYLETPLLRTHKDGKRYINTPDAAAIRKQQQRRSHGESTALLGQSDHEEIAKGHIPLKTMLAVALPSLLDLLQTVGANVGLLWISSSVYQMARGSVIIFSALFSVKLMNKRLYAYHYVSILIVAIAVVLVGWAGTSSTSSSTSTTDTSHAVFGLVLVVLTQLLTALQIVVEEHMMIALNVSPMLLVGLEGLWGLAFYVILIPVLSLTPSTSTSALAKIWHEDFYDSFVKVSNSRTLIALILAYIVAVGTLNVTANYVTKHLSAVMRSIAEVRGSFYTPAASILPRWTFTDFALCSHDVSMRPPDAAHAWCMDARAVRVLRAQVARRQLAWRGVDDLELDRACRFRPDGLRHAVVQAAPSPSHARTLRGRGQRARVRRVQVAVHELHAQVDHSARVGLTARRPEKDFEGWSCSLPRWSVT